MKPSHQIAEVASARKALQARPDHKAPRAQRVPLAQQDHKATRGQLEQPARLVLKDREEILVLLAQQVPLAPKVLRGFKV